MKNLNTFCLIIACVIGGLITLAYYLNERGSDKATKADVDIAKLEKERDSLKELSIQSLHREQQYILKMEQDSIKASGLEKSIALRESKIKTYQQRLSEVMAIPVTQPDSFLLKRYPQ